MMLAAAASRATASPPAAVAASDVRNPAAEHFVQVGAQRVVTVLGDDSRTASARKAAFREAFDQLADVPRISSLVLGRYGRNVAPDQRARFATSRRANAIPTKGSSPAVYFRGGAQSESRKTPIY